MALQNRSSHKDSKKSLFAPIEKETTFGSTSFSWTFLWIVVCLDGRGLDRKTTFTWTRIELDDYVYMDEDWIGVHLDGRGSDRRMFS